MTANIPNNMLFIIIIIYFFINFILTKENTGIASGSYCVRSVVFSDAGHKGVVIFGSNSCYLYLSIMYFRDLGASKWNSVQQHKIYTLTR